jgi:hypothetical protein
VSISVHPSALLRTASAVEGKFPVVSSQPALRPRFSAFLASWREIGSACDHFHATGQKTKHPASQRFSIPCRTRSCAIFGRPARTEFRHDSCNTTGNREAYREFEVSSLMFEVRGGRGTTARNKPNSSITDCGLAADLRGATNRAKQSQFLATPGGRRNSLFVVGDGVFARRIQNTVLAYVVFWCSGVLVFWAGAPKNAVPGPRHGVYLARGTWLSGFLAQKRG